MADGKGMSPYWGGGALGPRHLGGDPWDVMERMMDRMMGRRRHRLFRDFPALEDDGFMAMPAVDVLDNDDEVRVRASLPGVDRDDVEIEVMDDVVCIRGSTREEQKEEGENYFRSELLRGEFSRNVPLPASVDSERARATFEDGVLELVLPKTAGRTRRTIPIG